MMKRSENNEEQSSNDECSDFDDAFFHYKDKEDQSNSNDRQNDKSKERDCPARRPLARSLFRSRSRVPYRRNRSSERRKFRRGESPPRRQATKKGFLDELKDIFASQGKDFPEIDMMRKQMSSFEQQQMMNGGFHGGPQPVPETSLNPYVQQNMGFSSIVNPMDPNQQMVSEVLPIPLNRALKRPVKIENKPRQKPTSTSTDFVDMKKKKLKECKIDVTNYIKQMSHQITTAAGTTDGINYFVELMLALSKQLIRVIEDLKRAMNTRDDEERRHEASRSIKRSSSDFITRWSNPENPNTHERLDS